MLTTPLCHNTKLFLPRHCCCTTFALIRLYDTRASVQRNKSIPTQVTRCTCATTAPPLCQHKANQEIWHLFQCPQCHRTLECKISIISFWGELIIQNLGYGLVIKEQLCLIIFCATVTLNCDWHTVYPAVSCLATQQSSRAYPIHDTPSHQFHFKPDDPVSIQWFKWNLVGYTRSSLPRYLNEDWDVCVCVVCVCVFVKNLWWELSVMMLVMMTMIKKDDWKSLYPLCQISRRH